MLLCHSCFRFEEMAKDVDVNVCQQCFMGITDRDNAAKRRIIYEDSRFWNKDVTPYLHAVELDKILYFIHHA